MAGVDRVGAFRFVRPIGGKIPQQRVRGSAKQIVATLVRTIAREHVIDLKKVEERDPQKKRIAPARVLRMLALRAITFALSKGEPERPRDDAPCPPCCRKADR